MANKKRALLAVALFAVLGLTACDEVVAKPTDYSDKIVLDENGQGLDIVNNDMSKVYDSIREGALAGDVLDEFLYSYAVSAFGAYNHVLADTETYTLKDAARDILASCSNDVENINADSLKSSKANDFIKAHKAYWTVNDEGERIHYKDVEGKATAEVVENAADADKLEYTRVIAKWNTIEDRIAKTLYGSISGGTYNERNIFYEKEFVYTLYGNMSNVANPAELTASYAGLIWPEVEDVEVFTKTVENVNGEEDTLLHRDNYQQHFELTDSSESLNNTVTYVEDELIPDIYRTLLVEQYILDESYSTLGRSYARKVNILKITGSTTYTKGASYLMDTFINDYIFNAEGTPVTLDDFKMVSNAWTGAFISENDYATSDEYKLWQKAGLDTEYLATYSEEGVDYPYFLGTAYGDMMEKYSKISNNPSISENESEFTGSGAYVKTVGKEIKTREIQLLDNTTTGWFVKNGGLTDLPDSIRNRLYSMSVANAVNASTEQKAAAERNNGDGTYDGTKDFNNYVARINGKCYLKVDKSVNGEDAKNNILFKEGNDFYIVQIEEAISSSKLSRTLAQSYLQQDGYGPAAMEEIVNEVVKIVSDSEAYKTLSKKHWLEKAELKYHDQVIYDYFKANFPDLFE
ncbi:MAG: hypothetical protein MJ217_02470 [Bacilli bacterium]|nr:hypothetical protein [Bacilli bacterium]